MKSNETIFVTFMRIQLEMLTVEFVSEGRTVNAGFYLELMELLLQRILQSDQTS
jgi:hypothetical protein